MGQSICASCGGAHQYLLPISRYTNCTQIILPTNRRMPMTSRCTWAQLFAPTMYADGHVPHKPDIECAVCCSISGCQPRWAIGSTRHRAEQIACFNREGSVSIWEGGHGERRGQGRTSCKAWSLYFWMRARTLYRVRFCIGISSPCSCVWCHTV